MCKNNTEKDRSAVSRGLIHAGMLASFTLGAIILTFFADILQEKSIWLALVPELLLLCRLVHADLYEEHDLLMRKPSGH